MGIACCQTAVFEVLRHIVVVDKHKRITKQKYAHRQILGIQSCRLVAKSELAADT